MRRIILFSISWLLVNNYSLLYAERYLKLASSNTPYTWADYAYKGDMNIAHWLNGQLNWYLNSNGAPGFSYSTTQSLIASAYSVWQNASSNLSCNYISNTDRTYGYDNYNVHCWVDGSDEIFGSPNNSAITVLTVNSNNELIDADIVYNSSKTWYNIDDGGTWNDIQSVVTHEIGHSLGLHHTDVTSSPVPVMTMSAHPSSWRRVLKFDDIEGISFLYGGQLIQNETFSGTNHFNWALTIPSGVTITIQTGTILYLKQLTVNGVLTVNSGAQMKFSTGASLIVNGTLNASGTSSQKIYITRSGTSGTWGGIRFNTGSSGNIQHCIIMNADNGIYCYNSSPTITNCTIQNCDKGIYCDYYASPTLSNNLIQYNTMYGVYCNSYSSPNITNGTMQSGNVIRYNQYCGINASYGSNPNLGGSSTGGNSIYQNSSYAVTANYGCNVSSRYNWWGVANPPSSMFSAYQSTIDYSNALSSNPNYTLVVDTDKPISMPVNFSIISNDDELSEALEHQKNGNWNRAIELLLSTLKKNRESKTSRYALIKMEECFTESGRKDYSEFMKNELMPLFKEDIELSPVLLELEAHQLINKGNYSQAVGNLMSILKKHNYNKDIEKNTLFRLGVFYNNLLNDEKNADIYFNLLLNKYPEDELTKDIALAKGFSKITNGYHHEENMNLHYSSGQLPTDMKQISVSHYPNPFNPSTTIQFAIPESGMYQLKVYNMLGEEIAELVNNNLNSGTHKVTFDASRLASGMYIYRLTGNNVNISKKMLLMK